MIAHLPTVGSSFRKVLHIGGAGTSPVQYEGVKYLRGTVRATVGLFMVSHHTMWHSSQRLCPVCTYSFIMCCLMQAPLRCDGDVGFEAVALSGHEKAHTPGALTEALSHKALSAARFECYTASEVLTGCFCRRVSLSAFLNNMHSSV